MMPYEFWLKQLLDVMKQIADRDYQVRRWLAPDVQAWESPGELLCCLFDDLTFELFIERWCASMSAPQLSACKKLESDLNYWNDSTPKWPDLRETIDSPVWIRVREAAAEFIRTFGSSPNSPA